MRAVLMTAVGGPDVLEVVSLPEPEIKSEHDVLVRIRAAGINPVDYKLRANGTIGGSLPAVLGWDGAGVVESIGSSVSRVQPGDEIYFCDGGFGPTPGTYEEAKIVDERYLAHKPKHISFAEAAAAPWSPSPPGRPSGNGPGSLQTSSCWSRLEPEVSGTCPSR